MFVPVLVTPPDAGDRLITLEEAKAQCHVDGDDEDVLIQHLALAAEQHMDGYAGLLGRALRTQTWRQDFSGFGTCIRLPFPNASTVVLTYYDGSNAQQTVSGASYEALSDELGAYLRIKDSYSIPTTYTDRGAAVSVQFVTGYGAAAAVPAAIKHAGRLLVAHWFDNREAVGKEGWTELPLGVRSLLTPYRRVGT